MSDKNEKLKKLEIDNVDLVLLEAQRGWLRGVLDRDYATNEERQESFLLQPERDALIGLENMLDHWSDKRYFLSKGCNDQIPGRRRD